MAVHYRSQGIFVGKHDRREADQLFWVYTRDFGSLKILGKAIRKTASKLRGGADLFYLSDVEFIQGKNHKTLTDAVLIDNYSNIKGDLNKMTAVCQIADVLVDLTPAGEKDEQVWHLLNDVFCKLNDRKTESRKSRLIYYYFFWNLVSILGYRPQLSKNSLCGIKIDSDAAKILKLIFEKNWFILSRLKVEPGHYKLLENIFEWYNKENFIKQSFYEK